MFGTLLSRSGRRLAAQVLWYPFKIIWGCLRSIVGCGEVPKLVYNQDQPPAWLNFVLSNCKGLQRPFVPTWWAPDGHLQSIMRVLVGRGSKYRRQYFEMEDGDRVALDWLPESDILNDDVPIMVVLHGFSGNSSDVWPTVREAGRRGMRCVALNKRGHEDGSVLSTPKLLSFTDTSDLRQVLLELRRRYPCAPIVGTGFSAGSGLLCAYMNKFGTNSLISAAVFISPGYDSRQLFLEGGGTMPWFYNKLLNEGQKKILQRHRQVFEGVIDVDTALRSKTISEFSELVYCPLYGYRNAEEYWTVNNPMADLKEPPAPMMCLNAVDDPVTPECNIPFEIFQHFPSLLLVLTCNGGHCGFLEGTRAKFWASELACDFVEAVLAHASSNSASH